MTSTAIYFVFLFTKTCVDELRSVNSHRYPATLSSKLRFYVLWFLNGKCLEVYVLKKRSVH